MTPRLSLAFQQGLTLGDRLLVVMPTPEDTLTALPADLTVMQPFKPFHDHFRAQGFCCAPDADGTFKDALVFVPRAKKLARALIHRTCQLTKDLIVVDGTKTSGIDGLLKDIRKRVDIVGPIAKAHGKIFWFQAQPDVFRDWANPAEQLVDGYHTKPGMFSADGIDPASRLLAQALPGALGRRVADLGAGWGYLSERILTGRETIEVLDLVEADHHALACARLNVKDRRAAFHWSDALNWEPAEPCDTVVMNPPFHISRAADPEIGRGFIATAARALKPAGQLWMVANRNLPYEAT
ncbi:MAG: methyltransferase, partial [Pseudomonadota bacterium]